MKLKIHRGTKEIGGSCVEIWTETTRIIVDIGMPIVGINGGQFNSLDFKNDSVDELLKKTVLPPVEGLYSNTEPTVDAVLISHPHIDHYGLGGYVHRDIPFYLGKKAYELIKISNMFTPHTTDIAVANYFEKEQPFDIGDIRITPYWMDHSAFDAYGFLIEANGKSLFYSGDFRGHGRKMKVFNRFLEIAPKNVDCLLIEGTQLSRDGIKSQTEVELEKDFVDLFKTGSGINLVNASGQNIDRLVTIYRACKCSGKTLVMDSYTALVLKQMADVHPALPCPSESALDIKVMFPRSVGRQFERQGQLEKMFQFAKYKITKDEIAANKGSIVMLVRGSLKSFLDGIPGIEGGNIIHSLWSGYLKTGKTKEFVEGLQHERQFECHILHTSGHADLDALKAMVNAIEPKCVVPIHTFKAEDYEKHFDFNVVQLSDGETHSLN